MEKYAPRCSEARERLFLAFAPAEPMVPGFRVSMDLVRSRLGHGAFRRREKLVANIFLKEMCFA